MVDLPVRVEIREKVANAFVRFTLTSVPFVCSPTAKDIVEFRYIGWAERELAEVQYCYHACGTAEGRGAVVFVTISVADHGQLLLTFDKFKDSAKIVDLEASSTKPPPYYKLYRTILKLWGRPLYDHESDSPQALGGLLRATFAAVGYDDPMAVAALHAILIEDKKHNRGSTIQILRLLLAWDKQTGQAAVAAEAGEGATLAAAIAVFGKIKSVSADQLPACLRNLVV